ncbi:Uncharacterized protein GBIM_06052 [Gryllus bimaculatus]|nr:Uncharacterized protein GBIM_06052 [Gryllus bimaculatus]
MNLLLVVVPRYGAYAMVLTGALLAAADLVYWALLPARPLFIRLEGGTLAFRLGWCFWLVLAAGGAVLLVGLGDRGGGPGVPCCSPGNGFSTISRGDYDNAESHDTRNKKKKPVGPAGSRSLEEPAGAGLGSRILRRLSKRERLEGRQGVVNDAFEMEPPKSPWRYPFQRPMMTRNPHLQRSLSADSGSSAGGDVCSPAAPTTTPSTTTTTTQRPQLAPLTLVAASVAPAPRSPLASPTTPAPAPPTSPLASSAASSSSASSLGLTLLQRQGSSAAARAAALGESSGMESEKLFFSF